MARQSLAVLVSGRGSNLQAIIDAIEAGRLDAEIRLVISDKKGVYALERARAAGIRAEVVGRENRFETIDSLVSALEVDLVVLAGFLRILPEWFVDRYSGHLINIHPSLLPSFPGFHAQRQALEHGVKVSGCTVHFVDHGCDSGPIIMQAAVPVHDSDDEGSLSERILIEEHRVLPAVIALLGEGRVKLEGRKIYLNM